MCRQVRPRIRRIQLSYRRQVNGDVQLATSVVDEVEEHAAERRVGAESQQETGTTWTVRRSNVTAPAGQQLRTQTSVIAVCRQSQNEAFIQNNESAKKIDC
jgi:hypothetical protein